MSYNLQHLSTAGRVTVFTVIVGILCFAFVFLFNIGSEEFNQAVAQSDQATTTVTVVNLPPVIVGAVQELVESSTSSPTNSGDIIRFVVNAVDSAGEDYYLLICDSNVAPSASGGGTPTCGSGVTWAVSSLASSSATNTAATTTLETASSLFDESNVWYGFVCDNNVSEQRCSGTTTPQQGVGNRVSPFNVNNRPVFTAFSNNGPVNPDGTLTFFSTSSDPDTVTATDTVKLIVCSTSGFNTTTDECAGGPGDLLASSTLYVENDASAAWTLTPPWQDTTYNAYPYIIDIHGHEATGTFQGTTSTFVINNVAPTVNTSTMSINGGIDMDLTVEADETTGFTLFFEVVDNNSCTTTDGFAEVQDYELSLYRDDAAGNYDSVSSTTCLVDDSNDYNPNNCYTSAVPTTTWNLTCTYDNASCGGSSDLIAEYNCTFPLWFVADPTDATTTMVQYELNDWKAQVHAIDDDFATGTLAEAGTGVEVNSFLAFDLLSFLIPYGSLEPGEDTDDAFPGGLGLGANKASTTIQATGNVGLDERLSGESMCPTYTGPGTECDSNPASTVDDYRQVFSATSSETYAVASSSGNNLSSTTDQELEINTPKSTSTSTPTTSVTYWGIEIPSTISVSGDYTGRNTFIAIVGESSDW